ncbi:MAG: hypothetical protein AVDCRST_MAG34-2795 [uncultured Nocardioidaceae bacterium]|uniref:Uncharacterized protein n=1 Tax=uncultured Nocardioidaceae bacterium TaxID=253824 RepID=A0A6J4MR87_9ACTN|nr:MAG: hypothetical protein AVDCRST_MAG34-2795 [uncultured Nocardioidaceae bacterium]
MPGVSSLRVAARSAPESRALLAAGASRSPSQAVVPIQAVEQVIVEGSTVFPGDANQPHGHEAAWRGRDDARSSEPGN